MKRLNKALASIIMIPLLTGCSEGAFTESRYADGLPAPAGSGNPAPAASGNLVMHDFHDPQSGMVTVQMPFPGDWQVNRQRAPQEPSVTGPDGLKIYDFAGQSFVFSRDPYMQQVYSQNGQRMRAMPGVEALLREDIVPWAGQQGLKLVRHFEVPEVAQVSRWYQSQLYQVAPTQQQHVAIGSEWADSDGKLAFLLIKLMVSEGAGLQTWFYTTTGLEADAGYYEAAKRQLLFGLANARYNPQHIQAYNQREAQKSQQSWAAHNQRMQQNQASFQATQRAITSANDAVSNSIMQGWRDRNAMQDQGHQASVNGILEQNVMVDPGTGQQWQVDAGANNYWINQDGEYFTTDDYNYNPNIDPTVNAYEWQQLEER